MKYRRLGRTGLMVSEIGFGTCQLRMIPVDDAVSLLKTGFDLGVNILHTAPDYGGTIELIHQAVKSSGTKSPIYVCVNSWGSADQFEAHFEDAREKFGQKSRSGKVRLDLFGIASVEDREILNDNVWDKGGLVEFLDRKKREGSLGHSFCTSHGSPGYIGRLIDSDAFDAVMFAYNPLGFHMLSFNPPDARAREAIAENENLFALAEARGIGVMLMEVLGGGLLCRGRAFPSRVSRADDRSSSDLPTAAELLRSILARHRTVACLMPGTANVDEAVENATAAAAEVIDSSFDHRRIFEAVDRVKNTICSRCGACEELCSRSLPISWLFRAADINRGGAVPFETPPEKQYFDIHAPGRAACETCLAVTCQCPNGINIPDRLIENHQQMLELRNRGAVPGPMYLKQPLSKDKYAARLGICHWNGRFTTISVQNVGMHGWHLLAGHPAVRIELRNHGHAIASSPLRCDVPVTGIGYFAVKMPNPCDAPQSEVWIVFTALNAAVLTEICLGDLTIGMETESTLAPQGIPVTNREFAVRYVSHGLAEYQISGTRCQTWVDLQNCGTATWEVSGQVEGAVNALVEISGRVHTFKFPEAVKPSQIVRLDLNFELPDTCGPTSLRIDMVRQKIAYFSNLGSEPLVLLCHLTTAIEARQRTIPARTQPLYGVDFLDHKLPHSVVPKARFGVWVRLRNVGSMKWQTHSAEGRQISVVGYVANEIVASVVLPEAVDPHDEIDVHLVIPAPATPGSYVIGINLVHEGVCYFSNENVQSLEKSVVVLAAGESKGADLYGIALQRNSAFYHPSGGVSRLSDGTPMPQVLERAKGCYVWDCDGRRYVDYTMGWGCALLGHGNDVVEAAVRRAMGCGPTLPLPHRIELELTDELCQRAEIPCAESVAFGKNGSDVCTLAIRLARLATGRKTVLVCGYHGWQDWYAESLGFAGTGVPERDPKLVVGIDFNDTESLLAAIRTHRNDLAALILEPSGASGGPGMIGEDVNLEFLKLAERETRANGALLIFDEIITGFRYRQGSVQKATGITPDLACFGKALGNGFPVSALLGKKEILALMSRAFYGPTFKGEVYSLAAARAALSVYRTEPVADHVWWFGERLQHGLADICASTGVGASVVGPPFRTAIRFSEQNLRRRKLMRTLFIQELLRGGLITYGGVMLPSYAHTEQVLLETLAAFDNALRTVALCNEAGLSALHAAIEMPQHS